MNLIWKHICSPDAECINPLNKEAFLVILLIKQTIMKFYASVALAAILMTGTASAQSVNIGVKAGANFYNVKEDNGPKYDTKTGLHVGLLGHIHLAPQVGLQPEIIYSSQGAKLTSGNVTT